MKFKQHLLGSIFGGIAVASTMQLEAMAAL